MHEIPLLLHGRETGVLRLAQGQLHASCPFEEGYIYRVTLLRGAETIRLGVMVPQDGRFVLTKRIRGLESLENCSALIDRRLPGQTSEDAILPGAEPIDRLDLDEELKACFLRAGGLCCERGDDIILFFRWRPGQELIPAQYFALLTYRELDGASCCFLGVHADGSLFITDGPN
ncbi:MAG: hypothetical protein E7423_08670 [Ruminococcaceae bacterium]|nr:hypothetical protein [Oscillospiraceae bacterium]